MRLGQLSEEWLLALRRHYRGDVDFNDRVVELAEREEIADLVAAVVVVANRLIGRYNQVARARTYDAILTLQSLVMLAEQDEAS